MSNYENSIAESRVERHVAMEVARARRAHRRVVEKYQKTAVIMIVIAVVIAMVTLLLSSEAIGERAYSTLAFATWIFGTPLLCGGIVVLNSAAKGDLDHEDFTYRRRH